MLIDVHTHIFPDTLAERAISSIKQGVYKKNGVEVPSYTNGTFDDLLDSMNKNGVDISIVLPVATSVKQFESINKFAYTVRNNRIISFAGIHPMQENWEEALEKIKEMGFLGIKLHPEFQSCDIDGKECLRLLQKAEKLGLYTIIHAGEDYGVDDEIHATPKKIKNALEYISGDFLIAAHLGGWRLWDDVEKYLVGQNLFFDTAMVSKFIDIQQYKRIVLNHGSEKILFGSDSPWEAQSDTYSCLKSLNLPQADFENITYKNALRIFGDSIKNLI